MKGCWTLLIGWIWGPAGAFPFIVLIIVFAWWPVLVSLHSLLLLDAPPLAAPLGASSRCKDEGWNPRKSCIAKHFGVQGDLYEIKVAILQLLTVLLQAKGKFSMLSLLVDGVEADLWSLHSFKCFIGLLGLNIIYPAMILAFPDAAVSRVGAACMDCCPWSELCGDLAGFTFSKLNEQRVLMTLITLHSSCWGKLASHDMWSYMSVYFSVAHVCLCLPLFGTHRLASAFAISSVQEIRRTTSYPDGSCGGLCTGSPLDTAPAFWTCGSWPMYSLQMFCHRKWVWGDISFGKLFCSGKMEPSRAELRGSHWSHHHRHLTRCLSGAWPTFITSTYQTMAWKNCGLESFRVSRVFTTSTCRATGWGHFHKVFLGMPPHGTHGGKPHCGNSTWANNGLEVIEEGCFQGLELLNENGS